MKKILITILLIIMIPYIIVTLFIADDEVHFHFKKDQMIRIKQSNGNLLSIPFEQYITGVLAGEMPTSFALEALKAQAVAARSYALVKMGQNKGKDYDVVDTVMNQVYLDEETLKNKWGSEYVNKINKVKMAILETKGQYIDYNGQVAEAFFFSTSTGKTENVEEVFSEKLPYLRSVDSSFDKEVSPVYEDTASYTLEEFCTKLSIPKTNPVVVQIKTTTSTGRIKTLHINGKEMSAQYVVNKLSLRSTFFSIQQTGETITITTRGYGHGVGMSQYGAEALAKKGYTYDQILKHYYTDIQIKKI